MENQKYAKISKDGLEILQFGYNVNAIPRELLAPTKNYWLPVVFGDPVMANNESFIVSAPKYIIREKDVLEYQTLEQRTITKGDINQERNRRIDLAKTVILTTGKNFIVDMVGGGRENIGDMGTAALAKKLLNINTTFSFRDADNNDWTLTNDEVIEMGLQIMAQIQNIHVKARALKVSLPWDYWNDAHWVAE